MTGQPVFFDGQCGGKGIHYDPKGNQEMLVKIKNEMETAVRAEVAKQSGRVGGRAGASPLPLLATGLQWLTGGKASAKDVCPCPHCTADVLALALSNLPAGYCLSVHYGVGRNQFDPGEVRRQVQASLRRIRSRPRHAVGESLPGKDEVRLVDFGMREGASMVGPLLKRIEDACSCPRCRADALAYGLNRSRPRYGVEVRGRIRMPPHEVEFIRHDLLASLDDAARAVAENPRHDSFSSSEVRGATP